MTMIADNTLETALSNCRANPQIFADDFLGTAPKTDYQQKTFETLLNEDNHRVVIYSSNAMGKTHLLAETILTAFYIWGPGVEIITTAPSWNLVQNVLWAEIRNIYSNSKVSLGGEMSLTKYTSSSDPQWFIVGFSPKISTSKDLALFRGFHGPRKTIIVMEEGVGVPAALYEEAEMMMTGRDCYWWVITNTTDPNSPVAKLQTREDWLKIVWDSFQAPNVRANGIKNIFDLREEVAYILKLDEPDRNQRLKSYKTPLPSLLTLRWLVEKYIEWGEESFLFQSYCLARFPEHSEDTLISLRRVQECMGVFGDPETEGYAKYNGDPTRYVASDIARFGADTTVQLSFAGNKQVNKKVFSKKDTTYTAAEIKKEALHGVRVEKQKTKVGVDSTGVGGGTFDQLRNDPDMRNHFLELYPFEFGAAARNSAKYANAISEMWALAAEDFKATEGFILQKDELLMNELASRKYKYITRGGRTLLAIESKDDYKKRCGKSPDHADAFVIYNAMRHFNADIGGELDSLKQSYTDLTEAITKSEQRKKW